MQALRVAFVDWWFGNDDEAMAKVAMNSIPPCRKLAECLAPRGFKLEAAFPPGPESRPDLAIFSPYGILETAAEYHGALKLFWCNENLALSAFARYQPYADHFDYSFAREPTTSSNFRIASAIFHYQLPQLATPRSAAEVEQILARKTDFACFLYTNDDPGEEFA